MTQTGSPVAAPPIQALIIQPDGSLDVREIDQRLANVKSLLRDEPDEVSTDAGIFITTKNGHFDRKQFNPLATYLWWKICPEVEGIERLSGVVIVVGIADEAGDATAVQPTVVDLAHRLKDGIVNNRLKRAREN